MKKPEDFRKQLIESADEAIKSENPLIMAHVVGEISAYLSLNDKDDDIGLVYINLIALMSMLYS